MRDICLISRDAGHLMKMRDCLSECGTVDTYAFGNNRGLHKGDRNGGSEMMEQYQS